MSNLIKTAVIYARVSSVGDRQDTERQIVDLKADAIAKGYQLTETFSEHISGAKRNEERPVLCECLDYCFANHVNTLLVHELSRLGRNVFEVLDNINICRKNHLNIWFRKEQLSIFIDGKENPLLAIMVSVLGTCAEMERTSIQYRLNSGRELYIQKGGKLGRKVGYRKPKEEKKEQYSGVIKRLKKGQPIREIASLEGVSTFTVQSIKKDFFNL